MAYDTSKRIGCALIGFGRMGEIHFLNLIRNTNVDLVYVVDLDIDKCNTYIENHKISGVTSSVHIDDINTVLTNDRVEAVIISTPTFTHFDLVIQFLKYGKHVLCEKPIAKHFSDIKKCYQLATSVNRHLICAFNRRFDPSLAAIKAAVQGNSMGFVRTIKTVNRDSPFPSEEYLKTSGGMFMDCAIHCIDVCLWLLGETPEMVFATAHCEDPFLKSIGDVDSVAISMKFPSGAITTTDLNRHSCYGYDQRVEVFCEKGMLQMANQKPTSVILTGQDGEIVDKPLPSFKLRYETAYTEELNCFVKAVKAVLPLSISAEDTLKASYIAALCEKSYLEKRSIFLTEEDALNWKLDLAH